ncbi:MAG: DUF4835 family protein [Edaphocola sp.]
MKRIVLLLAGLTAMAGNMKAQDLNCKVDVTYDRVQNVDAKVFQTFKKSLTDFVNNRKWTEDTYNANEKIDCSFLVNFTEQVQGQTGVYKATINIQSSRPVFGSGYSSSMVNYVDREVVFRFDESQTIQFNDANVSGSGDGYTDNLPAIVAYYIYLIIGFDYDSFAPKGGEAYFRKAQNVVNNAPGSQGGAANNASGISGWTATNSTRNRYWLIDQILSPRFAAFRPMYYNYHRKGLDLLHTKPEEGRKAMLDCIPTLTTVNNANPTSILFQFFFNAKWLEFVNVLTQTPAAERKDYVDQLSKMDVPHTAQYRSIQ